uniref:Retrotransposon gag domain-containing protein n=1 Tax=Lactuca sativa TaxID=4236 RepID=A0A9R1VVP5_LACSA|nr:hypothetical protein LSAT_V11C400221670 [Lactuca sativa]
MIHLLPTFGGLENEDPHKFLKEFHVVCSGMKPHAVTEDQIKLRAFPFSHQDSAREWLYELPSGSITTWTELAKLFLEKYFPETRVSSLRREILGIKQGKREALHTYWERFKKLLVRCPQHGISDYHLYNCFCEGLTPMERRLINASGGGSLGDMTPTEIRELIEKMAIESKHSGNEDEWYPDQPRGVKEVSNVHLEAQISKLTKVVLLLIKEKAAAKKQCGICLKTDHLTDMCPILQEDTVAVKAPPPRFSQQRNFQQPGFQQKFQQQNFQNQNYQNQNTHQQPSSSNMALEDIVKSLATSTQSFQTETRASIKNLEQHVSQLATSMGRLESQGKLPGHTEINPKHNVTAISLRSRNTYEGPSSSKPENKDEEEFEEVLIKEGDVEGIEKEAEAEEFEEVLVEKESEKLEEKVTPTLPKPILKEYMPLPPFPSRLKSTKRERDDEDIMEILRKVEILSNISLTMLSFLKICANQRKKMKFNEILKAGKNISSILQKSLPPKCTDPGIFSVPCKLGNLDFPKAMLDLGASVNVLPNSVFEKLKMETLKKTGTIIQLADHSTVHPKGVLEDVLVQVDNLLFPADFYILDMGNLDTSDANSIILGRPFLKTAKTKIDVFAGTLSMEFDGISSPFSEDCCDFSNGFVQDLFLDRKLDNYTLKELNIDKLGEMKAHVNSVGGAGTKLMEKAKLEEDEKKVISDMKLKKKKKKKKKLGAVKKNGKRKRLKNLKFESFDKNLEFFPIVEQVPDPPILPYLKGSGVTRKIVELQGSPNHGFINLMIAVPSDLGEIKGSTELLKFKFFVNIHRQNQNFCNLSGIFILSCIFLFLFVLLSCSFLSKN